MYENERPRKGKIFKRQDGTQIGFFQLSHDFMKWQVELKGSSVKIYICLVQQAGIRNTLKVEAAVSKLIEWTGIKENKTISSGIRELAEKGWIRDVLAQTDKSNVYIINLERQEPNIKLLDWLDERAKKNSENSKKLFAEGKVVKGERGRFQKVDKTIKEYNDKT